MRKMLIVLLTVTLVACSQPQPTSLPPTLTTADLDLTSLLFQDGDLPADFRVEKNHNILEDTPFRNLPSPASFFGQEIRGVNQDTVNLVYVLIYEDLDLVQEAFDDLVQNSVLFDAKSQPFDGIGEYAHFQLDEYAFHYINFQKIAFARCNALVYIETSADTVSYARQLDSRLMEAICPG